MQEKFMCLKKKKKKKKTYSNRWYRLYWKIIKIPIVVVLKLQVTTSITTVLSFEKSVGSKTAIKCYIRKM